MLSNTILMGRLTRDPQIKTIKKEGETAKETVIATYQLAVNRDRKVEGQPEADFIFCKAFNQRAKFVENHLKKGTKITVAGRLQTRSYDDKDGQMRYTVELIVQNHYFCDSNKKEGDLEPDREFTHSQDGQVSEEEYMEYVQSIKTYTE